jgi:hypothetical protein
LADGDVKNVGFGVRRKSEPRPDSGLDISSKDWQRERRKSIGNNTGESLVKSVDIPKLD